MFYLEDIPGRTTELSGVSYLFFSGFAYLGMPSLETFQENLKEGVSKYGAVFPSSRVSNTQHKLYDEFEQQLSDYTGWQATASFSSGYVASLAAVQFVSEKGCIYALQNIHPSLRYSQNLHLKSNTQAIIEAINESEDWNTILLESVNPLTGQIADFRWLSKIKRPIHVVIDDAHGIGILGKNGAGIKTFLPHSENLAYLVCYSLSKAFSCEGGAISGHQKDISQIKTVPPFTASTPMSPAFVYAWMESQNLFQKQLISLRENLDYFKERIIQKKDILYDNRLPTCFFPDATVYERALSHHILLSAFRYPTKQSPLMTRAVINALHTKDDLNQLIDTVFF